MPEPAQPTVTARLMKIEADILNLIREHPRTILSGKLTEALTYLKQGGYAAQEIDRQIKRQDHDRPRTTQP